MLDKDDGDKDSEGIMQTHSFEIMQLTWWPKIMVGNQGNMCDTLPAASEKLADAECSSSSNATFNQRRRGAPTSVCLGQYLV